MNQQMSSTAGTQAYDASTSKAHCYDDLIAIFEQTFLPTYNTRLIKGGDEPIYLPAGQGADYHQVVFAHGFYASAFHEIAHWCLAGEQRRLQEDYGYWYAPDGRSAEQQAEFEKVEIKPQAIEWAFCVASGFTFNVSADNLGGIDVDRFAFQSKVHQQVLVYLEQGFPPRAKQFIAALAEFYQTKRILTEQQFQFSNPLSEAKDVSVEYEQAV